jgi:hypothetical protein
MSGMKSAIDVWVKENMKLDVAKVRAETGLVGTPLLDKYRGEEKGEGWRKGQTAQGLPRKTEYYDDPKKQQSEVSFDKTGKASSDGKILGDKAPLPLTYGYVLDPQTAKLHQFGEADRVTADAVLTTHHSSPLDGKDAAGAGEIKTLDGRITEINDRSGHYRPDGTITFQAVRQINLTNMPADIRERLKKTDGRAETPDTLEQVVAAEIGKKRDAFFKALDQAQADELAVADKITDEQLRKQQIAAVNAERHSLADEFRKIAKSVEDELRQDSVRSPLVSDSTVYSHAPELVKLSEALKSVEQQIKTKKLASEDTAKLEETARKMREELAYRGYTAPSNKETMVSLLGKTGMLTDQEYAETGKNKDKINAASALKQLVAPIGEEEFGKLVKQGKDAVAEAIAKYSVKTVAELKAKLGQEVVDGIKGDNLRIAALAKQYGVKQISADFDTSPEMTNFAIGQASAVTLTAEQFLQTGGNEAQIRNKQGLKTGIEKGIALKPTETKGPEVAPELGKVLDNAKTGTPNADEAKKRAAAAIEREKKEKEISSQRRQTIDQLMAEVGSDPAAQKKMLEDQLKNIDESILICESNIAFYKDEEPGLVPAEEKRLAEAKETKKKIEDALANL